MIPVFQHALFGTIEGIKILLRHAFHATGLMGPSSVYYVALPNAVQARAFSAVVRSRTDEGVSGLIDRSREGYSAAHLPDAVSRALQPVDKESYYLAALVADEVTVNDSLREVCRAPQS